MSLFVTLIFHDCFVYVVALPPFLEEMKRFEGTRLLSKKNSRHKVMKSLSLKHYYLVILSRLFFRGRIISLRKVPSRPFTSCILLLYLLVMDFLTWMVECSQKLVRQRWNRGPSGWNGWWLKSSISDFLFYFFCHLCADYLYCKYVIEVNTVFPYLYRYWFKSWKIAALAVILRNPCIY